MNRKQKVSALRTLRESLGLTLKQVGDHIGISPQRVHYFEKGLMPSQRHLSAYAEVLKISEDTLFRILDNKAHVTIKVEIA